MFKKRFSEKLTRQREKGLYRAPLKISHRSGKYLVIQNRKILNFSSNDYLGLASDSRVRKKLADHFNTLGSSASSSRLVSANYKTTLQAESAYAKYFGYESALFFPSGFQANLGIISALFEPDDLIFFDKHVHASAIQGIKASSATFYGYNHSALPHLEKRLGKFKGDTRAVITESLFSMDGDILDVTALINLKNAHHFLTVVDEAHTFGAMGDKGKGISKDVADIAIGTFGKSFGLFGAFVLMPGVIRDYIVNFSAPFIYTTALPEAHAAAAIDILDLMEGMDGKRLHLKHIAQYMKTYLRREGFNVSGDAHILAIEIGDESKAALISKKLLNDGIFAFAARYPTVPRDKAILRIAATALHDEADVWYLVETLKRYDELKTPQAATTPKSGFSL